MVIKKIINEDLVNKLKNPIINLHIGYLPFNRGFHPNLWSFLENTPSGVTIHEIDKGLNTGPIILQKQINFKNSLLNFNQNIQDT
jgi:methionyl-tRNA formyltransferase